MSLSLRSGFITSNSQNRKSQELRPELHQLYEILSEIGVILKLGSDDLHILQKEQAIIVRDIDKYFSTTPSETDRIKEFIRGLKTLCGKEEQFKKLLKPTELNKASNDNGFVPEKQENLMRIFIKVGCLQKEIVDILLTEITSICSEEIEDTSWLHMLLNCLRYLPHIKDGENLSTRLLDILEIAPLAAKHEILDSIPEILPDNQYGEASKQLCKLLDDNDELSGAIIDCLGALNLDTEMRNEIQDRVLAKMLSGTSLKIFPVLLQFLLIDIKSPNLVQTLLKIRNALDSLMPSGERNKEKDSCKILIFNKLQMFAISPKIVAEAWLNMISSIKSHADHKPIDCLLLFMLHTCDKPRRRIIEGIFRKRSQMGLFKITHLEKMFEKYILPQLLNDYFSSIVDIGCNLLRTSNNIATVEFASTLLKTLFNHKYTEVIYRKELLDNLIVLTGSSDQNTVGNVLAILSSLLHSKKLQQHTPLLMRLLEKLDSFSLKNLKEVFEVLCALTCSEQAGDSMSSFKDEIHIIVRKLLSSCQMGKSNIKHRGIISAIVMTKHIAVTFEDDQPGGSSEESIVSIAQLPKGRPREAACLLELTYTCTSGCPELIGLYYDQLASMLVKTSNLNKSFLSWLYETITNDFQKMFIEEEMPKEAINNLELTPQYSLNSSAEMSDPIGVNIAPLTLGGESNKILLLAPHFRLLRLLSYRQFAGDLSNIDALVGASVLLPNVEDVQDLDFDQAKQVADCLFHCANWFREVISGFVTQKGKQIRAKVIRRVMDLIEVEKKLMQCLDQVPEHKLPVSYFDSLSQVSKQLTSPVKEPKGKNPKKKFKSAPVVNDPDESVAASAPTTQKSSKNGKTGTRKGSVSGAHCVTFRVMDTDLIILLKYPLKFDEDDDSQFATQTGTLDIEQLKFILKDYVTKLMIFTLNKNTELSHINVVIPIDFMKDTIKILPNINNHLRVIVKKINQLLEKTDGRHDLPELFTEQSLDLKKCFSLILEAFYLIFSWPGFQHSSNLDLLREILKSVRSGETLTLNSANRLTVEFIERLVGYTEQCLHLEHAVNLVNTMDALYKTLLTPNNDIQKKIANTCRKLLDKRWYNNQGGIDGGKNCNANIEVLVRMYLCSANIKVLCGIVGTLQEEAPMLKVKEDCLRMLRSIDKQNFHVFYFCICNALLDRVKTEIRSLTNSEHLVLWKTTTLTMQGLQTVAKVHETRSILGCFLKKSIGILKVFISHGLPILEIMLRSKPDDAVAILKTMQTNTRFLHHLCCYSKVTKDSSLVTYVPTFRLTLETLIYRVKAALVANNCSAAFWMGNLRNKNLQGEDIISQSTVISEENEEEEEMPPDDDDDDILADDDNSSTGSMTF